MIKGGGNHRKDAGLVENSEKLAISCVRLIESDVNGKVDLFIREKYVR